MHFQSSDVRRRASSRAVSLLILVVIFLCPPVAFAQDAREQMLKLNEEGFEAFSDGRFVDAAEAFRAAHEALPEPALRKNESIAWFKAERCPDAVTAAHSFLLEEDTSPEDRVEVRSVLANCKVEFARMALDADSFSLATALLDEAESLQPDDYARDRVEIVRAEVSRRQLESGVPDETPVSSRGSGSTFETVAWILTGTGGAILVGAFAYHMVSLARQSELRAMSEDGGNRRRFSELQDAIGTSRWLIPTLYGLGAVSLGTGVTMTWIARRSEGHESASGEERLPLALEVGITVEY